MTDVLTALDATFLELEELDDGVLMGIGGVMIFDPLPDGGVPSLADVHARLIPRLGSLPRCSQRLSTARTGGFSWPHWESDDRIDTRCHVRRAALPAPGSDAQLCDFTAELFSHPMDRRRPLWELVLVEGLEGGRWALAQKTHHCLVDGVGSLDVLELLLDSGPNGNAQPGPGAVLERQSTPREPSTSLRLLHPPEPIFQAARASARAAGGAVHAALYPSEALDRSRAVAETIIREELSPAPRTSLNVSIGQTRRFAIVRVPLAELKAIRAELGGSVNDVVLAACASGLRRLLSTRGDELPSSLRAMVPMNLRVPSGPRALGNRVSSLFVDLPIASSDPRERLAAIASATRRLKSSGAAVGPTTLVGLAELLPPVVLRAALARTAFGTRLFNLTITNVAGPERPLYAFGSRLREVHPVVPLAAEHAVGIAVFSVGGLLTFGINADAGAMPDLEVLAYAIEEGIEELEALLPNPPNQKGDSSTCQYA